MTTAALVCHPGGVIQRLHLLHAPRRFIEGDSPVCVSGSANERGVENVLRGPSGTPGVLIVELGGRFGLCRLARTGRFDYMVIESSGTAPVDPR